MCLMCPEGQGRNALNESFGFGGQNNVIIIKRFQEDTQG